MPVFCAEKIYMLTHTKESPRQSNIFTIKKFKVRIQSKVNLKKMLIEKSWSNGEQYCSVNLISSLATFEVYSEDNM